MKAMPLISVIVPVYNVQDYLVACVESIWAQTYQNLEIWLVDDGSTDESGALCDELAKQDERIRVLHKPNGGLSDARNAGIERAKGEYFVFVDSDDLIPADSIEILERLCEQTGAEAAIAPILPFTETIPERSTEPPKTEVLSSEDALRRMFLHQGIGHEAFGKLYRRSIWESRRFPKWTLYEDYAAVYPAIADCKTVVLCYEPLYYYRVRNGSIMHSGVKEKNLALLDVGESVTTYMEQNVPALREEAAYLQIVTSLKLMKGILDEGMDYYPEAQKRICAFVRSHRELVRRPWAKKADRIKVETLLLNKRLFYWVYELGERRNAQKLKEQG